MSSWAPSLTPAGTTTCTAIPLGAVMLMLPPGSTPGGTVTIISCVGEGACAGTWTWKVSPGPLPAGDAGMSLYATGVTGVQPPTVSLGSAQRRVPQQKRPKTLYPSLP